MLVKILSKFDKKKIKYDTLCNWIVNYKKMIFKFHPDNAEKMSLLNSINFNNLYIRHIHLWPSKKKWVGELISKNFKTIKEEGINIKIAKYSYQRKIRKRILNLFSWNDVNECF